MTHHIQTDGAIPSVKGYVPRIVREFVANLSKDIDCEGKPAFRKVFIRLHLYKFSPKVMCDFIKFPCLILTKNMTWMW